LNTQKQIALIVVFFFLFAGSCTAYAFIDAPRAERQQDFYKEESIRRGALLFANNCRTCHGAKGEGGVGLSLNTPDFKDQAPLILNENRAMLRRTIECGRAGTLMPSWLRDHGGSLTSVQIEHLINLITAPADRQDPETGDPTSEGWLLAEEFSRNLNRETSVIVSGDTLDTIARQHFIGPRELAALNNIPLDEPVRRGARILLPDGRRVEIFAAEVSVQRIAEDNHVGAILLAEHNNLAYRYDRDRNQVILLVDGREVPGLLPGDTLSLPDNAVYIVRAGDTPQSIAELHGITVSDLRNRNPRNQDLQQAGAQDELEFQRSLALPPNAVAIVQVGQALPGIALTHGLEVAELAALNNIPATATVAPGTRLQLPANTRYRLQIGDTLDAVARAHNTTADELRRLNNIEPGERVTADVVLQLPPIRAYRVQGQSVADIAEDYANVSAQSLAEANQISPDAPIRVGSTLRLPEDAWGTAPPTALNPGTACVQFALPQAIYETLPGVGTPRAAPQRPAAVSQQVVIEAGLEGGEFFWRVVADGQRQPNNQGAALIRPGTAVRFVNVNPGLHSITVNGQDRAQDISAQGDERTVTFEQANTTFQITCKYHPAMHAWLFTE
jgi:LysM repeat protein/mono/diheme cytochrome c family protein